MSWLWGKKAEQDPTKSLDNDLKQFLDSQQPGSYTPTTKDPAQEAKISKDAIVEPLRPASQPKSDEKPVPKESLFQDGRYKDIWKTYVPQSELVQVSSTPAERIMSAKKDRKASLSEAALENCAFEEELKRNCFSQGDSINRIRARVTLCNRESKAFNRCFQLQAKFLQALGYQENPNTDPDVDERIQMHADKLYHRMMDYEAAVEEAKAAGKPVPPLTSVFNPDRPAPTLEEINLPPNLAKGLKTPLKQLPPHERELSARAILQETKVSQAYADDFFKATTTMNEGRERRQKLAVDAFGETLGKFFIPDAPKEHEIQTPDLKTFEREFWKDDTPVKKG